jgi:hypothetical protein
MGFTARIQRGITLGTTFYGENRTITCDAQSSLPSQVVNASTTNQEISYFVDFSQLGAQSCMVLYSTQDLTIKTNSSGSPTDTITLTANGARVWAGGESSCPFSADVTKIYVTNATGSAATVTILVCYDATP